MNKDELLGKIAYEAYVKSVGGLSIRGEKLPKFEEQSEKIKTAWIKAGVAVCLETIRRIDEEEGM